MVSISQVLRLPIICTLCNQYHQGKLAVCDACSQFIRPLGPACQYCATPLPDSLSLVCGFCIRKRPSIDHVAVGLRFEEPLRSLLHEFKYHEGLYLTSFFVHLMLNSVTQDILNTDCLIPVPMHSKRLQQRGFNQAQLLAKKLARAIKRPYNNTLCRKIINTDPQAALNAFQRQRNLHQAFQVKPVSYQHITIIDDLLTTGNTANELAKQFKRQGVSRVTLWCCAKTVGH